MWYIFGLCQKQEAICLLFAVRTALHLEKKKCKQNIVKWNVSGSKRCLAVDGATLAAGSVTTLKKKILQNLLLMKISVVNLAMLMLLMLSLSKMAFRQIYNMPVYKTFTDSNEISNKT